jgi:hypothetical protein
MQIQEVGKEAETRFTCFKMETFIFSPTPYNIGKNKKHGGQPKCRLKLMFMESTGVMNLRVT